MSSYYLGIDQGTTTTTALLIDEAWQVVARGQHTHRQIYPQPGWVEHDPLEILEACRLATAEALRKIDGARATDIRFMGIDHQGETCLVWERQTGLPLTNAIVWQDRRTADLMDGIKREHSEEIQRRTGLLPDAYYSASKIQWILDHVENARERANRGELMAGTLNTWLIWKLTGGQAFVTDGCSAGRTMLLNLKTMQWDPWMTALMDIPKAILPPIRDCNENYGITDPDEFLGAAIPIAGCLSDSHAGLIGGGGHAPGTLKTSYGTGAFMNLVTGDKFILSDQGLFATCGWMLSDRPTYTLNGAAYIAGAAVQWLRDGLELVQDLSEVEPLAASVPDTAGVVFVPAFTGLATPYWDPYARGAFLGLTASAGKRHLVRAVLESTAFQVCDCYTAMREAYPGNIPAMRADGGMVDNRFLMQFQADILGIPVEIPEEKESAAFGAACMAGLTMGEFSSLAEIQPLVKLKAVYEPAMAADQRGTILDRWHRAVTRCMNWIPQGDDPPLASLKENSA